MDYALNLTAAFCFIFVHAMNVSMLINTMQLQVIEAQVEMPIVGAITLYVSLLTFTLRVHPDRLDYVDQVLVCFLLKVVVYSIH